MKLSVIEQELLKGNIKHDLKLSSKYYDDVMMGRKNFELRKNDRDYQVGDIFVLREYNNMHYTGRYFIQVIGYVLKDCPQYGFMHNIPLIFCKNYSPQVLKANMRVVGATEYALLLYRDKLPKFRNIGLDGKHHMVFNWFEWRRDSREIPKIHPAQKPVNLLETLIKSFTDEGDVVIDPCAGSGTTLRAAHNLKRDSYGFEIDRTFFERATNEMLVFPVDPQMSIEDFIK